MLAKLVILSLLVENLLGSPVSLSKLNNQVELELVEEEPQPLSSSENKEKDDDPLDVDKYKNYISEKTDFFNQKTDDITAQMERLESEMESKLAGLEEELEKKKEEENKLRNMMQQAGIKDVDAFEKSLDENIVPSEKMINSSDSDGAGYKVLPDWLLEDLESGKYLENVRKSTDEGPIQMMM